MGIAVPTCVGCLEAQDEQLSIKIGARWDIELEKHD